MSDNCSTRAGRYERQDEDYSAFVPKLLPPNPRIRFNSSLQTALSNAERALLRLDGTIQMLSPPEQFVPMYLRHEAVLSCKIEGLQSSMLELLADEAQISTTKLGGTVRDVMNYVSATEYGLERIKKAPVALPIVLEIHKQLLENAIEARASPGTLRTKQNWIGPPGCGVNNAVFVPPPPHLVEQNLRDLDRFMENDMGLPALVKIGLAHAQFETIHPFLIGNGRLGRILVSLLLQKSHLLKRPVLNLSWFFFRHRQQYYSKLQCVRDEGDWENWLLFFLRAVDEVSRNATATAARIAVLRDKNRRVINAKLGRLAANGHRVLDRLFEFPFVSVNEVRELIGTTFASANTLVARMVDCGLLQEYTERYRNRRYLLYEYVDLFKEQ